MSFYSFIRTGFKLTSIAVLTLGVGLAFQNCSTQFSSGSPEAQASLSTPNRVIDDRDGTDLDPNASELKIELYATAALQEDCSVSGENYQFEILNSPQDITMCTEYVLDMPEGYPIQQESYSCNDINVNDKFVPPSSKWSYSASERKWSFRTMANSTEQMPGDYRLYVRSGSSVAKSALLKVRRSGYANCGSQTAKYAAPEPVTPPSSGGGGGAVVPTPAPPSPSPSPVASGTTCNPPGTKLVRFDTQIPGKAFNRTNYPMMKENEIYVFAFKTPNDFVNIRTGMLTATKLSSTRGTPTIVVSTCPGDISFINKGSCSLSYVESTSIFYIMNTTSEQLKDRGIMPNFYCYLKPNTQYYASVFVATKDSYVEYDKDGAITKILPPTSGCTQSGSCGLSFEGN